jgi:hypothetical protein
LTERPNSSIGIDHSEDNMGSDAAAQPTFEAKAYSFLVQALNDPSLKALLWPTVTDAGKQRLLDAGFSSLDQCNDLLQILHWAAFSQVNGEEAIKADKQNRDGTNAVVTAMRNALAENVTQTAKAFGRTMWMYIVSFYMGVALIAAAIAFAWLGKESLLPMVFGGLGTANTLAFFFTKPPERLQSSRASLAQLQCALLSWFSDFVNQQILMAQLNTANKLDPTLFKKFSEDLMGRTDAWMKMLQQAVLQVHIEPKPRKNEPDKHPPFPFGQSS